jgi:hypothetical protein
MSKKNRLSRDQKRKAKLAKVESRSKRHIPLAYSGKKYKTEELVPLHYRTEVGIMETFVMTDRQLTDRQVEAALEKLILQLREGAAPLLDEAKQFTWVPGQEEEFLQRNIHSHWAELAKAGDLPIPEKLIGVLRTILGSIEVWSTPGLHARGYLHYVEGFLKKMGTTTRLERSGLDDEEEEDDEETLLALGHDWIEQNDPEAALEFRDRAENMLQFGEAEEVLEVCQQLIGMTENKAVITELSALSIQAQQVLKKLGDAST